MRARTIMAAALALILAVALALLSQLPTTYARPADALLRLSWRVDAFRVEECRARTPAELEALAPHMRTPEVCTGGFADFELRLELDGTEVIGDTLRAGGARGDRPVYVYRDLPLAPGRHRLSVAFDALVAAPPGPGGAPVSYRFEDDIAVDPQVVALITLDAASARLVRALP